MPRKHLRAIAEAPTVAVPPSRSRRAPIPELRAILDRASPRYIDSCPCAACERRRAEPFRCGVCGYVGTPHLYPCGCPEERARALARLRDVVDRRLFARWRVTPTEAAAYIAHLEATDQTERCPSGPDHECVHGVKTCPVCGVTDEENEEVSVGADELARIIHDVRAALSARGLV